MKRLFLAASFLMVFVLPMSLLQAQEDKMMRPSPPAEATATISDKTVTIHYSSPAVKGRTIWGELVPYGKVWRTGANEATVFETSGDLEVNGQKLPAGKYSLFTIPGKESWTVIFNSVYDQWGAFRYDPAFDVLRINVTPVQSGAYNERLKFDIKDHVVSLLWENMKVSFVVK